MCVRCVSCRIALSTALLAVRFLPLNRSKSLVEGRERALCLGLLDPVEDDVDGLLTDLDPLRHVFRVLVFLVQGLCHRLLGRARPGHLVPLHPVLALRLRSLFGTRPCRRPHRLPHLDLFHLFVAAPSRVHGRERRVEAEQTRVTAPSSNKSSIDDRDPSPDRDLELDLVLPSRVRIESSSTLRRLVSVCSTLLVRPRCIEAFPLAAKLVSIRVYRLHYPKSPFLFAAAHTTRESPKLLDSSRTPFF